jgi:hypothetical protein
MRVAAGDWLLATGQNATALWKVNAVLLIPFPSSGQSPAADRQ